MIDEARIREEAFTEFYTGTTFPKDTPEEVVHAIFRSGWEAVLNYIQPIGDSRYLSIHLEQLRQDLLHERGRVDHLIGVLTVMATSAVTTEPADGKVE